MNIGPRRRHCIDRWNGRRWRELVYPEVRDFIRRYNQADAILNGSAGGLTVPSATPVAKVAAPARKRVSAGSALKTHAANGASKAKAAAPQRRAARKA